MRWKFNPSKPDPKQGDVRVVRRYAWYPQVVLDVTGQMIWIWLEYIDVTQYLGTSNGYGYHPKWVTERKEAISPLPF